MNDSMNSIDTCEPWPSWISKAGRVGGILCWKESNHCKRRSWLIYLFSLFGNKVFGMGQISRLWFLAWINHHWWQNISRWRNTWNNSMGLPPLSWCYCIHITVTEFSYNFTRLMDDACSHLVAVVNLHKLFNLPYKDSSLPKKLLMVSRFAHRALQYNRGWGEWMVCLGWRLRKPSNHALPAFSSLKGWFRLALSTILWARHITVITAQTKPHFRHLNQIACQLIFLFFSKYCA